MPTKKRLTQKKPHKKWQVEYVVALIAAIALIGAALITGYFTYLTGTASWQEKAKENNWIPKNSWKQIAKENGLIPKNECNCSWKEFTETGEDKHGRSVRVKINILSGEYRWIYDRSDAIELGGVEEDLRSQLNSLDMSNSKAIICIGAASVEGKRAEQSNLALDRADRLIAIVRVLKPQVPLYGLNLGRHKYGEPSPSEPLKNAIQRRVIVLEIIAQEENVNLHEAIFSALVSARESIPPIPFDIRNYFEFQLYKARV